LAINLILLFKKEKRAIFDVKIALFSKLNHLLRTQFGKGLPKSTCDAAY